MPSNILVPPLGESIVEATVSEWLKKPGDPVDVGDTLVRLETDKVDLEVGAEHAGVLSRIEHQAGDDVKIGDVLGVIAESAGETSAPPAAPGPESRPAAGTERGPDGGQTASAAAPANGEAGGGPAEREPETGRGAAAPAGADGKAGGPEQAKEAPAAREAGAPAADATPVARRVAEELGINLARVPGSGPKGRVTKEDVEEYAQRRLTADQVEAPPQEKAAEGQAPAAETAAAAAPAAPAALPAAAAGLTTPAPLPAAAEARRETRERMSRRRQTIARRLVEAQHNAAMLTTFNEIDMTAVMDVRKRRKDPFRERYGVNLGFTSFFVKAAIGGLRAFPRLNAEIQGDEMVLKAYYDIGIAVGASEGLVVPVLRDADRLNFGAVEQQVKGFAEKAQQGTLTLEDLRGGTFTITNGGVFGSLMSTPILNPPQVGILGLHKIEERPVARGGQVEIRSMMYVALSYDHRIVDGREAVQFLVRVKELIEDPELLMLEG